MQIDTRHTQQESIYQQNLSTGRQTPFVVDSNSEIELTDTELAFICGGQDPNPVPSRAAPSPPNSGPTHNQNGQSSFWHWVHSIFG